MLVGTGRKRDSTEQDLCPVLLLRDVWLSQCCGIPTDPGGCGRVAPQGQVGEPRGSPWWGMTLSLLLRERTLPFSAAVLWRANWLGLIRAEAADGGEMGTACRSLPPFQPRRIARLRPCPAVAEMSSEFISRLVPCQLKSRSKGLRGAVQEEAAF